jgi:cell division protein FtsZ
LVNITASSALGLREYQEVMAAISNYTAPDATVICGAVFDDAMEDQLRVTVVATGLGSAAMARRKPELKQYVNEGAGLRTGTDNMMVGTGMSAATTGTGVTTGSVDDFFTPTPRGGARDSRARDFQDTGMDKYDIPAFLRKQAD